MRLCPILLAPLALAACEQGGGSAEDVIGHRWARTLAECGHTYLDFARDRIDFVSDGRTVNALTVRRAVSGVPAPSMITLVIETTGALVDTPVAPAGTGDVALVFAVGRDSLKLVSQGSGDRLRSAADMAGLSLRRCP